MHLGLRVRIVFIAASVVLATMAVMMKALESRSFAIGKSLKLQLERMLTLGIAIEDLTGFEEQCQEIVSLYPGISQAFVAMDDGRILFNGESAQMNGQVTQPTLLAQARDALTYGDGTGTAGDLDVGQSMTV